jgi:hypothetical protein
MPSMAHTHHDEAYVINPNTHGASVMIHMGEEVAHADSTVPCSVSKLIMGCHSTLFFFEDFLEDC